MSVLIAGTTSDAGKSLVTAGVCRWLARRGVRVAPFKSQNMSNNSMVCPDGTEIGRAQWLQAVAAGATPQAAMNPVLLKPGSDRRSHVVLMGSPWGHLEAGEWATSRRPLAEAAFAAWDDLAARYDVVVAEGAGSPAEVNLRPGDYVNLGLARAKDLPVLVVGDIDRGGVLAAMYGTWALLEPADRALLQGWIVNKFRGDLGLLQPGLDVVRERTGLPVFGVLPWLSGVWLDSEDALALAGWQPTDGGAPLTVAVVRFPRISNATDVDALAAEPGVRVDLTTSPEALASADLVVLPGSRRTVADLAWLRELGLDQVVAARAAAGRPVLGICGGHQMLSSRIEDEAGVELPGGGTVDGLGLLPTHTRFGGDKVLALPSGEWRGHPVGGYEIHHGVVTVTGGDGEPFLDGWRAGSVFGTTWHGTLEHDGFRRALLTEVAHLAGRDWAPDPSAPGFDERRHAMLDRLADAVEEHLDCPALLDVIGARPAGELAADGD